MSTQETNLSYTCTVQELILNNIGRREILILWTDVNKREKTAASNGILMLTFSLELSSAVDGIVLS